MPDFLAVQKTIKDTFSLKEVPRDTMVIGLAGVVPYFVTSAATLLCSNEIIVADRSGTGYLFTAESAEKFLHILEPLQVGYGAVVCSPPWSISPIVLPLTRLYRSSHSSARSIGVWSSAGTAGTTATDGTRSGWSRRRWRGRRSSSAWIRRWSPSSRRS